jgi:hypothetical protein
MQLNQQINAGGIFLRATKRQRIRAGFIFLALAVFFGLFLLAANGKLDLERWLTPCGFKQRSGLPCPTCGITSSVLSFVQGRIFEAFYIQPAGALFCVLAVVGGFLAFLTAVFGVYYRFLKRFFDKVRTGYLILGIIIIIAVGWLVTLVRALTGY